MGKRFYSAPLSVWEENILVVQVVTILLQVAFEPAIAVFGQYKNISSLNHVAVTTKLLL